MPEITIFQCHDSAVIDIIAKSTPKIWTAVRRSPKMRTPIQIVISKLLTDHIVPTTDRLFCCMSAGNHANAPRQYMPSKIKRIGHRGSKMNFLERYSPPAKNRPEIVSHRSGGNDGMDTA